MPILLQQQVVGTISVDTPYENDSRLQGTVRLLSIVAVMIGQSVAARQRARAEQVNEPRVAVRNRRHPAGRERDDLGLGPAPTRSIRRGEYVENSDENHYACQRDGTVSRLLQHAPSHSRPRALSNCARHFAPACFARASPDAPGSCGCFARSCVRARRQRSAADDVTCWRLRRCSPSISFREVGVPDDHRIGEVGGAEEILLQTLDYIRFGGTPVILGITVGALRDIVPFLETRKVFPDEPLILANSSLGRECSKPRDSGTVID